MNREDLSRLFSETVQQLQTFLDTAVAHARAEPILSVAAGAGLLLVIALVYGVRRRRRATSLPAEIAPPTQVEPAQPVESLREAEPMGVAEPVLEAEPARAAAAPEPEIVEPAPRFEPAPEAEVEAPLEPVRPRRLRERLRRTSEALIGRLEQVLGGRRVDAAVLEELEHVLYTADLGVATAESLLAAVRKQAAGGDAVAVRSALRGAMLEKLRRVEPPAGSALATTGKPHVILVLGVNGSGKTTTIGKLAARYRAAGKHVILGAGDTFRAAAIEQLQAWGERAGCEVIAGTQGGDPSAVAFDTVKAALARGADVVICDTAGRLQTKQPLIEELKKIVRVLGREVPGAPHESLLVLDANTGQNAISQARVFIEAARVTGLVLTKLDGTAKGGVLVGLGDEFGIPVKYVGVGEGVEDLRDFSADEFVEALFETDGERGAAAR
jgi:fused signal recognition particle receptor